MSLMNPDLVDEMQQIMDAQLFSIDSGFDLQFLILRTSNRPTPLKESLEYLANHKAHCITCHAEQLIQGMTQGV